MAGGDFTEVFRRNLSDLDRLIGIEITEATATRVRAELPINSGHLQVHGVVHGGVYSYLVETTGSIGGALAARVYGLSVVGMGNHTTFLRSVSQGTLRVESEPVTVGERSQVWSTRISDDDDVLVAVGQLRLMGIERESIPHSSRPPPPPPGWEGSPVSWRFGS